MLAPAPARKLVGHPKPRIAPPLPARSGVAVYEQTAKDIGIELMPWQKTAGRYIEALGPKDRRLFQEVAVVVARQNGKTTLLRPLIVSRLRAGKRIMHTAQNRELPREIFRGVVEDMEQFFAFELRGKPRFANGQEEIRTTNGGVYRIVAPTRGGARGPSNDLVILDEARELVDYEFIAAAKPTLTASKDPQFLYLSNAGAEDSEVLNDLRVRRDADPSLAYLEWSAAPGREPGDREGWRESNPALGHLPGVLDTLEREHRAAMLTGKIAVYETEHLCRWVVSDSERAVDEAEWLACEGKTGRPSRPYLAIALDPSGSRASAALAWRVDEQVHLRLELDVTGSPVDTEKVGGMLQRLRQDLGVKDVGYDDWTDRDLARWMPNAKPLMNHEFAAASEKFNRLVRARTLTWSAAEQVTEDLRWLTRKPHESGAWLAVRANDEHTVTAALAAIRAAWMASEPPRREFRVVLA